MTNGLFGLLITDFFAKSYLPSSNFHFNGIETNNLVVLNISSFTDTEVRNVLKQTKSKSTIGPDNIPAFMLRDCAYVLARPSNVLINKCLRTSSIPQIWKLSKVCPSYKKGDKSSYLFNDS